VYTSSMETIYLSQRAQVAVGTFFMKSPVYGFSLFFCTDLILKTKKNVWIFFLFKKNIFPLFFQFIWYEMYFCTNFLTSNNFYVPTWFIFLSFTPSNSDFFFFYKIINFQSLIISIICRLWFSLYLTLL